MNTSKPFSTIFHGSDGFLKMKLDDLVDREILEFYAFINHLKEEDEKKDHKHVFMIPSKRVDTNALRDYLKEFDPTNPKPIVPIPFESSKFGDWYLYSLHDSVYLASKGQERKYHYTKEEFKVSDEDYFNELIHKIDMSKFKTQDRVKALAEQGIPFQKIVSMGIIPIQQIAGYKIFYDAIVEQLFENYQPKTKRNGRNTHDDDDLPF